MERYKLLASAVIKKGGRISIEELGREWVEKIDPTRIGFRIGPQDRVIYDLLKAGIPPYGGRPVCPVAGLHRHFQDDAACWA